jgi:cytochrome bd-type quinol oxidase subunit 1
MHVEPPGHAPQSLKDFGIHYLMIVAGILTAVGIEQGIEAIHHHELATQATEQIEEELKANLRETSTAIAENQRRRVVLKTAIDSLASDIAQKKASDDGFVAGLGKVVSGTRGPTLRRDAWDAAIASQALSHVGPVAVRRYSGAYSTQADAVASFVPTGSLGNWPGMFIGAMTDARVGKIDQAALLKALATYDFALAAVMSNELELETALKAAVGAASAG